MKLLKIFLILFLFSNTKKSFSQSINDQEIISKKISEYYKFDRENIHLHFNKISYLTNEDIWFKGYIIEKKLKSPYPSTSNVYVNLIDNNGIKLDSKLFYAENSTFEGNLKLNETLKTGKYYVQVYTNFMNNFSEDESSIFEINIINPVEKKNIDDSKIIYDDINVTFFQKVEHCWRVFQTL